MAVSTWTPKAVVDLFPRYLTARGAKFVAQAAELPAELMTLARIGDDLTAVVDALP